MEEPVTQPSVEQNTVQKPTPSNNRARLIILIVIVALLIIAVLAAVVPINGKNLIDRFRTMQDLRDLSVGADSYSEAGVQSFGMFGLKAQTAGADLGTVGDYAEGGEVEAAIITGADGAQHVWLLGSEPKQISQSAGGKASLAVSPDGTLVAYAARAGGEAEFESSLSAWTMHVIDLATGTDVELNAGFDPHFFTRDGSTYLLYTSPEGVEVTERATDGAYRSFLTPFEFADSVNFAVKVSEDGAHIAVKSLASRTYSFFNVFRATADMPLGLEPIGKSERAIGDVAFSNGNVFWFANGVPGVVWGIDLDDLAKTPEVYRLPEGSYRFVY